MKDPLHPRRPFRRFAGGLITCLILLAVLLVNVGVSAVGDRMGWYADGTVTRYITDPSSMYTLTDDARQVMEDYAAPVIRQINDQRTAEGESPLSVQIIFCNDRDRIEERTNSRYVLYTALELERAFPEEVEVSFVNISKNPSAVQRYKATSAANLYPSNVIVAFGTEYRVLRMDGFYIMDDATGSTPWAYHGEKHLAAAILGVTRVDTPICAVTVNHGEDYSRCASFLRLIESVGYEVRYLDLSREEIPENCRLMVTYDPQEDFHGYGNLGPNGVSEVEKLDRFLDEAHSFVLFVDHRTPKLPNLEEYLEEWGVAVARGDEAAHRGEAYTLRDPERHVDDAGYAVLAEYAVGGLGASITSDMRKATYPPKVLFPDATALPPSDCYLEDYHEGDEARGEASYGYASYHRNGVTRNRLNVFLSGPQALAEVGGATYEVATADHRFPLMTLTQEVRMIQESDYTTLSQNSHVCVLASTAFAEDELLESAAYGNSDVLASMLRSLGQQHLPVSLERKVLKTFSIMEGCVTGAGTAWSLVLLSGLPLAACGVTGGWILLRRRRR